MPLLLYGKKHYSGIKFESSGDQGKRDIKGLACVRKDQCPFIKALMLEVIDHLLSFHNQEAMMLVRSAASKLLGGDVPLEQLVMSSQLGDNYKTQAHPHVRVAELMEGRDSGTAPRVGDRVHFVWVEKDDKKAKGFERAEDPSYVRRNSSTCRIDRLFYYEHQMEKPVTDLFAGLVEATSLFADPAIVARLEVLKLDRQQRQIRHTNAVNKQRSIKCFLRAK